MIISALFGLAFGFLFGVMFVCYYLWPQKFNPLFNFNGLDTIELFVDIENEIEKALFIRNGNHSAWIPKSQILEYDDNSIIIKHSIAKKAGFI